MFAKARLRKGQIAATLVLAVAVLLGIAFRGMAQNAQVNAGAVPFHYLTTASTNAKLIKGSIGNVYIIAADNTTATIYYLKFYDKSTAPVCGTDTPVMTLPLPALTTAGPMVIVDPAVGVQFINGIGFCVTGGIADNDNTNAAAGVAVNVVYQ